MSRYIALLRAINVGGHVVTMAQLRKIFGKLGFTGVETFIASGNVIFDARGGSRAAERRIEAGLAHALGYEVGTFVRTPPEIAAVARYRPFSAARIASARTLNVGFLVEPPAAATVKALMGMRTDIDDLHLNGRELYWLCLSGQGESKITNVLFERTLGGPVTFRNVRTVSRLAERYCGPD